MAENDMETLLKRMPEIAQAVNTFQSPELQREAFQSLIGAFWGNKRAEAPALPREDSANAAPPRTENRSPAAKAQKRGERYAPKILRDLDLAPTGKKSFKAFVEEKQPKSNEDKYAVAVYYFENEANISAVTLDHVFTVFRVTPGWKEPTNIISGITTTASRKGTIDTKDFNSLKMTPHGRNFVEHDLPPKKAAK